MFKKIPSVIIVAAALFCAGGACGWLMRGGGGTGVVAPVRPAKAAGPQATAPNGRDVRTSEADVAEPQFEEAIPAAAVRRERAKTVPTPTVEEVKGEDGLTVDERLEKFKRERPDEFAALQRRRESIRAARKAAADNRQELLDSIDVTYLTEEQRKTHAAYANALVARQQVRERMAAALRTGAAVSDADRAQLQAAERVIREQGEAERAALFEAAARSFGVAAEEDVKRFRETISAILEMTREQERGLRRR